VSSAASSSPPTTYLAKLGAVFDKAEAIDKVLGEMVGPETGDWEVQLLRELINERFFKKRAADSAKNPAEAGSSLLEQPEKEVGERRRLLLVARLKSKLGEHMAASSAGHKKDVSSWEKEDEEEEATVFENGAEPAVDDDDSDLVESLYKQRIKVLYSHIG
jgi:hypothetical protein